MAKAKDTKAPAEKKPTRTKAAAKKTETKVEEPQAAEAKAEGFEATYAFRPSTPEEAARISDILTHWHDCEASNPLPLEWLVASLQAGRILDPPEGR